MTGEKRGKDPVKVAAGKKGGRPRKVNAKERATVRVSEDWYVTLRSATEPPRLRVATICLWASSPASRSSCCFASLTLATS